MSPKILKKNLLSFNENELGQAVLYNADCFALLDQIPDNSIHAIVTDPPYGVKEFHESEIHKMRNGGAGIWRIPPSFDGNQRAPLPRFTALNESERAAIEEFFIEWSRKVLRVMKPGGHLILASNSFLSQLVFSSIIDGGFEFRTQLIRLVMTLRGGDRPKLAEKEYPDVCTFPRGAHEPWGVFRKPLPKSMKVSECLKLHKTGGLRREVDGQQFKDVIESERTPKKEREIANHPSLKPQSFMRKIVYASLPLGEGIILDPFMGSGSTIAAAEYCGLQSIGIERDTQYYEMALSAIPKLAKIGNKGASKKEERSRRYSSSSAEEAFPLFSAGER